MREHNNKQEYFSEKYSQIFDKLFYFPGDKTNFLSENTNLSNVEKFLIKNPHGDSISVWKLNSAKPKGQIIHCHGSGYNISSHFSHVSWLPACGFDVFMFDYPGYGDSTGIPTRKTTVETACCVIQEFSKSKKLPVFVLGQSLGANIASVAISKLQNLNQIDGLILDSMYSSFKKLGAIKIHRKYIKKSMLLSKIFSNLISEKNSPLHHAEKLNIPTLILHSRNDDVVPYTESINFYNKMTCKDVEFWSHLNSGHTDVLRNNIDGYRSAVVDWMNMKLERKALK